MRSEFHNAISNVHQASYDASLKTLKLSPLLEDL